MRTHIVLCAAVTALLLPLAPLHAQADTSRLATVVVSAAKAPVRISETSQAVTVITGSDLRARGVARVADALKEVPGLAIVQSGSVGSVTSLFTRGGESRYTKVLVDGVAINAVGGFVDLSHLTTENIDRIEVVRGSSSVVHGADAVSGVVQIFTRTGAQSPTGEVSARAGSHGWREGDAAFLGRGSRGSFSVGGGAHRTSGIHSFNNQYYNGTLSGSGSLLSTPVGDVRVSARLTSAEFHFPTDFTGAVVDSNAYRVQHRLTVSAEARSRLSSRMHSVVSLGGNDVRDLTENIVVPFGSTMRQRAVSDGRAARRIAEARLAFDLPQSGSITVGGEYLADRENSESRSGPLGAAVTPKSTFSADRTNRAAYVELLGRARDVATISLSGRRDDNSEYDEAFTYRGGFSVRTFPGGRVRASLGTSFNAPAFNQLRPTLFTVGRPELDPEHSRSAEIGAEQSLFAGALRVSAALFRQTFTDLIQFVSGGPPTFKGSFANLTEARSNGSEFEATFNPGLYDAKLRGLTMAAAYNVVRPVVSKLDARYTGGLRPGDQLLRRATRSGSARVSFLDDRLYQLSLGAVYVGDRPDRDFSKFPSPTVTLPAYTLFNASAAVPLPIGRPGRVSLTARAENLFDREYADVFGFDSPGRTILIGARYTGAF